MAKKAADQPDDGVRLSAEEAEALSHLIAFALEAEVERPPYRGALESALEKLGLIEEQEEGPAALEAVPMPQKLPVRAQ